MSDPIRILHIFGRMQRGGAEMRTLDVMRHIDRERFQFHFCTLSGLPGELDDSICELGGYVHPVRLDWTFPSRFRRLLRDLSIDVVHSHVHYFSGAIARLAAKAHVPVRIVHFRSTDDGHRLTWRRRLQRALFRRWIGRFATRILAVSEAAMARAWDADWRHDPRCQVIYNGIPIEPFLQQPDPAGVRQEFGWSKDCRLILHVGRMDVPKNHTRLLKIFAALAQQQPDCRLLLVGDNDTELGRLVRTQITALGLNDRVGLAGVRADVSRLLLAADLLLFPSLWEGLPGAVLEAAAAGTPVAASDLPGVREIARHFAGVHAWSLEDSDDRWAVRVMEEALSPRRTTLMRIQARQQFMSSAFSIDACVRHLGNIWSAAVHAPAS